MPPVTSVSGVQEPCCRAWPLPLTLPNCARAAPSNTEDQNLDNPGSQHEPMFNVPGSVLALLGLMVGVHIVRMALPELWESWVTLAMAFVPARYDGYAEALPGGLIATVTSFLTYAFVHGDLFHLMINAAWFLAFGGIVAMRLGAYRFLLFSALCAVAGAAAFLALNPGLRAPMVGASGAVAGLMGGTMRFLFSAFDGDGLRTLRENPQMVPMMPLARALTDPRVLIVTGAFVVINFLAVLGLGGVVAGGIAWEAHLGGYFAGLFSIGLFERAPRSIHQVGKL